MRQLSASNRYLSNSIQNRDVGRAIIVAPGKDPQSPNGPHYRSPPHHGGGLPLVQPSHPERHLRHTIELLPGAGTTSGRGLGRRKGAAGRRGRQARQDTVLAPAPLRKRYEHAEKSGSVRTVPLVVLELGVTAGVQQHHHGSDGR